MKRLTTCQFQLENFPGSTFVLKIKKELNLIENEEYENQFYYFQIDVKKINEETIVCVSEADFENFPIYIDNVTDYSIKISEGDDEFVVKPQHRIPFAWSHLNSSMYML